MKASEFRSLVVASEHGRVEYRLGQRPIVTALRHDEGGDMVVVACSNDVAQQLVAAAERLAAAASAVFTAAAAPDVDLGLDLASGRISGGRWYTVLGGPYRRVFSAAQAESIRAALADTTGGPIEAQR